VDVVALLALWPGVGRHGACSSSSGAVGPAQVTVGKNYSFSIGPAVVRSTLVSRAFDPTAPIVSAFVQRIGRKRGCCGASRLVLTGGLSEAGIPFSLFRC